MPEPPAPPRHAEARPGQPGSQPEQPGSPGDQATLRCQFTDHRSGIGRRALFEFDQRGTDFDPVARFGEQARDPT